MSIWSNAAAVLNAAQVRTFGQPMVFTPASTAVSQTISGAPQQPSAEEYQSGVEMPSALKVFVVLADISPTPVRGDTIVFRDVVYTIAETVPDADLSGGATLKLRANA